MMQRLVFMALFSLSATVYAGTVRLVNDTAFQLRAVIYAADGTYLGEVVVPTLQTMSWNDYWGGVGIYNVSRTPYRVVWYCVQGNTDFSACSDVATGATVTATVCDGTRSCTPKQKPARPPLKGSEAEQNLQQNEVGPPTGFDD